EPPRRLIDLRLALSVQIDDLGVAAAFKVEDAVVAPAVLVVADEHALGVAAQRGFARAAQTEEQGYIVAVLAEVGAAMHRQNALLGHEIVHGRENALLDLAGVLCTADKNQPSAEIDDNERLAVGSVQVRLGL